MSTEWRLFLAALRCCARRPPAGFKGTDVVHLGAAARYVPVAGALIGALGGAVYWLGAQIWPTSIAVILSMTATEATTRTIFVRGFGTVGFVFALLLKYNTLMALSAASLPFAVPANVALGLIMICGHTASRAVVVSLIASPARGSPTRISNGDQIFALSVGFAPAILLGIPGLIGLAAAILARAAFGVCLKRNRKPIASGAFYATQQLIEICFYLAALASWRFV
jgi:adenosylcobinamide-GDP ribazoletransferase